MTTIRAFGIGQLTGIELPGENHGLLRPLENWTASSIGSLAMGQEVSVTPIQIISAISAVANGGTLYRPRIVREIDGGDARYVARSRRPQQATDATNRGDGARDDGRRGSEGTGKPAQLDGYTAAGKSGTAQKIDPATGRYSATQYNSSFVGFAPVNDPAVTILVVLDSPVGPHHGGEVGGPVFKRVAEQVLAYLDVPHDVPSPSDVETAKNGDQVRPQPAEISAEANDREMTTARATRRPRQGRESRQERCRSRRSTVAFGDQHPVVVPSLTGQTVRASRRSARGWDLCLR